MPKNVCHFVDILTKKSGPKSSSKTIVKPDFLMSANDIMKKGGKFYAVLDPDTGLWTTNESYIRQIVDGDVMRYVKEHFVKDEKGAYVDSDSHEIEILLMNKSSSGCLKDFNIWFSNLPPNHNYVPLDTELTFKSTEVNPFMYRSKRLDYDIVDGSRDSYEKLMSTLYSEENRQKIEWSIGAVLTGDSKEIEKMLVLYGDPGSGKSTILDLIKRMFTGYWATFLAEDLVGKTNQFATALFKDNPLVAIQDDGSMAKIESPVINEIISHKDVVVNEKQKSQYTIKSNAFLFLATNELVDLRNTKLGITRRLLDVYPSGKKLPVAEYRNLVSSLKFEIPAIAYHCKEVYESLGKEFYIEYTPEEMIQKTNYLRNFLFDSIEALTTDDHWFRDKLYDSYKLYCEESGLGYPPKRMIFGEQLREYFDTYDKIKWIDGRTQRHVYTGIRINKIMGMPAKQVSVVAIGGWLNFNCTESILDKLYSDCLAQYANDNGTPKYKWEKVRTKLKDIDRTKFYWVKFPDHVIKIDFDLKGADGNKSLEESMKAANKFPKTYAEVSKSGCGVHLYYIYDGDPDELADVYAPGIEIKKSTGNRAHRRLITKCNDIPIQHISTGLPLKGGKGGKPVVDENVVATEKGLRTTIEKCLNKEVHGYTRCEIDWIYEILERAHNADLIYDVSDMRPKIVEFAIKSTHQAKYCLDKVRQMKFASEEKGVNNTKYDDRPIVFFDVEVFPNLFVVCWKYAGENNPVRKMINPSPNDISEMLKMKLVGFNNRDYDNHILYARYMNKSLSELYYISQAIISGQKGAKFREAYNLSYTDIYDFSFKKQSLKKWEIELGIHHQELGLPWDQPVEEKMWDTVAEYCENDVIATEQTFLYLKEDWVARQILADLAGASVNDTTNTLTLKIVFGDDKKPELVYTDMATGQQTDGNTTTAFPGYSFERGEDGRMHNMYRGVDLGFGGYVYAEPGMYTNVALIDAASMHPTSIVCLNKLGKYTERYADLRKARVLIKHHDWDELEKLFDGRLMKYIGTDEEANALSTALKYPTNAFYGISSAHFDNPARDPRDRNNIIALRGALFMKTLMDEVNKRGFKVISIRTDSCKIPDATDDIIKFVQEFGQKYGYEMEHEATYEKMCLVNDAVYIAKYDDKGVRNKGGKHAGEWTATGAQFMQPYIFKTLFSKEPIEFKDMCETKSVKTAIFLDFNEKLPEGEHDPRFVGKVGQFCPVKEGYGGGILLRENVNMQKFDSVTGTKGYRWLESEVLKTIGDESWIDISYYTTLADKAVEAISKYGDFEWFVSDEPVPPVKNDILPDFMNVPETEEEELPFD